PGGGDDADVLSLGEFDQAVGFIDGGGHRLVDVHVLAGVDRLEGVLGVQADRGYDRDQVDVVALQEVVDVRDGRGDAETLRCSARSFEYGVADRGHDDAIGDVVLGHVREDR